MSTLNNLVIDGKSFAIQYVETQTVKEGVECDTYIFINDKTKDLAIVRVAKGSKTPFQKILKGTKTIEGYRDGKGILTVTQEDGTIRKFEYPGAPDNPVSLSVGQTMQWQAIEELTFYEICEPPYEDGRFENLPED